MILFGVLLGLGLMAGMIYMALNKKSNLHVRIASLVALGIMIITIIICLFIIFTDDRVPVDESILIVGAPVETKKEGGSDIFILLLLVTILIALFITIAIQTRKEHNINKAKEKNEPLKPISSW